MKDRKTISNKLVHLYIEVIEAIIKGNEFFRYLKYVEQLHRR